MNLKDEARRLREQKRRELEALYPALKTKRPAMPGPAVAPSPPSSPMRWEKRIVYGRDRNGLVFCHADDSRFLHTHIIGVPKSGKSNSILHGIKQDLLNGACVVLFDPHGNHPDSVLQKLGRWIGARGIAGDRKVYLVDPGSPFSCGFNALDCPDDTDPSVIAGNMLEAVERGWGDEDSQGKPSMRRGLRALFIALAELKLTLIEAPYLLLPDDQFNARAWALQKLKDERARAYLQRLTRLATDPRMAQIYDVEVVGVLNWLEEFTSSAAIRRVFGQQRGIDLRAAMDGGGIVLVNLAGGTQVYEREGDLLGRMFLRALLFNAKRRTNTRPCFVWMDEGHRFVSGDVPTLFEEVRKNAVGITIAHQDLSQLGIPGDRVREAVLAVPQNRLVFRLNSMAEATLLAPEVVKLNLELPVATLIQPAVVGHTIRRMRTQSVGAGTATTANHSQTVTTTDSHSTGKTMGGSRERHRNVADSVGTTHSSSTTRGHAETNSQSRTRSRSTTETRSESETHSTGTSHTIGESASETSSRGGSENVGDSIGVSNTDAYGYDSPPPVGPLNWPDTYTDSSTTTNTRSGTSGTSWGKANQTGRSSSSTVSESTSFSRGRSYAETVGEAETEGTAHTESVAETDGVGRSTSRTVGSGESEGRNWATSHQHGSSIGFGSTSGTSTGQNNSWSSGFAESLVPIMEDRPGAVHSKENVVHMAAEVINNLPTGTAIVKALVGNKIEAAVVTIPFVEDSPEKIAGEAMARLRANTPGALPIAEVDRMIAARREWLKAEGAKLVADQKRAMMEALKEAKEFRVSGERWKHNPERKGANDGRNGAAENQKPDRRARADRPRT